MERVSFLVERTGQRLGCLLNPETLVVRRWAGLRSRASAAGRVTGAALADDPLQPTGGGRTELDLDLLFDVSLAGSPATEDVRDLTRPLWDLAENGDAGGPAQVRFVWGKSWNVPGVVAAIAERLENFTPEGVARRSWLRMRLLRAGGSGPTAQAGPRPADELRVREVAGGQGLARSERLDTFLGRNQVDPRDWKVVAALNGLDDPYAVPPGAALRLPPGGAR